MKRAAAAALALAVLLGAACLAESTPVIYRVTDDAGHVLYLMGTVHMGTEDMYPLGGAFEEAWQASDLLAVECNIVAVEENIFLNVKYARGLMLGFSDSVKNHLSAETCALGPEAFGVSESVLDRLRPAAWLSLAEKISMKAIDFDPAFGVDRTLISRARREQRQVLELEGLDAQLEVLSSLPDEVVDAQILRILKNGGTSAFWTRMLTDAWQWGDERTFEAIMSQSRKAVPGENAEAYEAYDRIMITDRNEGFARRAIELMQSGQTALIAIGAAHVIGEDSVTAKLHEAGYTVERMK